MESFMASSFPFRHASSVAHAAQRRAGETGILNIGPAAQAGSMLEQMSAEKAIAIVMVHAATWRARGEEKARNFWLEVRDELVEVARLDAEEGRRAG